MAGAPGFEPGLVSSEPTALPLGHAPRRGLFKILVPGAGIEPARDLTPP